MLCRRTPMSPTSPIPISAFSLMSTSPTTQPKDTPSSSISISPQTPFSTNQNLSTTAPNPNSGILQWARSFKSPPSQAAPTLEPAAPPAHQQKGFDIPAIHAQHDDHDHDEHDSFEFGDLSTRSWGKMGRRAVSMSVPSGQGISSMLTGFGATSPPKNPEGLGIGSPSGGLGIGSPPAGPAGGVMADKTARGQGVLRRLSISGSFAKVSRRCTCSHMLTTAPHVLASSQLGPFSTAITARSIELDRQCSCSEFISSICRDGTKVQHGRRKRKKVVGLRQEERRQSCKWFPQALFHSARMA